MGKLQLCDRCGFKHAPYACLTSYEKIGLPLSLVNPNIRNYRKQEEKITPESQAIFDLSKKGQCFYCERKIERLTIDHIIPLSLQGTNSKHNKVHACGVCNSAKGNLTLYQFIMFIESLSDSRKKKTLSRLILIEHSKIIIKNIESLLEYKSKHNKLMRESKLYFEGIERPIIKDFSKSEEEDYNERK